MADGNFRSGSSEPVFIDLKRSGKSLARDYKLSVECRMATREELVFGSMSERYCIHRLEKFVSLLSPGSSNNTFKEGNVHNMEFLLSLSP